MKRLTSLPLVLFIWLAFVTACATSNHNTAVSPAKQSIEYKLAYLDSLKDGKLLRDDDVRINRIRYLLENIAQKSGDSKEHIADRTAQVTTFLHEKYGKDVTNAEFLEQANSFYTTAPKTSYDNASNLLVITLYAR